MQLVGTLTQNNVTHFISLKDIKGSSTWVLISPIQMSEKLSVSMGQTPKYPVIKTVDDLKHRFQLSYVEESLINYKQTGKVKRYGTAGLLEQILENLAFARNYKFNKANIETDEEATILGEYVCSFAAKDKNLEYSLVTSNGLYNKVYLNYKGMVLNLAESNIKTQIASKYYTEVTTADRKRIVVSTLKRITLADLREKSDMSWYEDASGKPIKKYKAIKSIQDFELQVIYPLVCALQKSKAEGVPLPVAVDTETTGLFTVNLSKDNPAHDHCVAVPITWQEDTGFVVFTDMEHFENVPNDYVLSRLEQLFHLYDGERTFQYWEPEADRATNVSAAIDEFAGVNVSTSEESPDLTEITAFGTEQHVITQVKDSTNTDLSDLEEDLVIEASTPVFATVDQLTPISHAVQREITIQRSDFTLIGHNFPFDRRTIFNEGYDIWFDEDTLQMGFDLHPTTVRGSNKLKGITRRLFQHETPELSDILGKGNEDKYKYLEDEIIATIYGCADADYTLKTWKYLRSVMTDSMYYYYKKQDVEMLNILALSEYYGMQTYPDKVEELANTTYQNVNILKQTAYEYVGVYIDYKTKVSDLEFKHLTTAMTDEEYQQQLQELQPNPKAIYEFDFTGAQLRNVLYNILHYPILSYTSGANKLPSVDKHAIARLLRNKVSEADARTTRKLQRDILVYGADPVLYAKLKAGSDADKKKAEKMCLLSADEFNSYKYPLALIIKKYAELNKEYTSYFKPLQENNLEGKMFYSYSLARIETRRIMNPGQTMKGNLKALIRSYSDDHYMLDFDMSQVEYRIMLSLAKFAALIVKMKDPESDYHTETAAMINHIPAHAITKKQRKQAKSVSFGVPYGLGDASLCETMFGEVTTENLIATRMILANWKENNHPIMALLESARDRALQVQDISLELRNFMDAWQRDKDGNYVLDDDGNKIPTPIGMVFNEYGFYRTFDLSNVGQTQSDIERRASGKYTPAESTIRRAAGNYPIQSFAAEVFRLILIRFYKRCVKEGIADKVIWHMLIHDELLCSVHKSVHPFLLYKIVKEECMITMPGHTRYFIGINIGDTWAECKDDSREAPVHFVTRMIKRYENGEFRDIEWFDHPWEFISPLRKQYVEDRIGEVIKTLQPDIDTAPIDIPSLLQNFTNYTVRSYVNDYPKFVPITYKVDKDDLASIEYGDNLTWASKLQSWMYDVYGEGKQFIDVDGNLCTLHKTETENVVTLAEAEVDFADLFNDEHHQDEDFWSFDEQDVYAVTNSQTLDMTDEEPDMLPVDLSRQGAKTLGDLTMVYSELKYVSEFNRQVVIKLPNHACIGAVKEFLLKYQTTIGRSVLIQEPGGHLERWIKVKESLKLKDVEDVINQCLESAETANYKYLKVVGNCITIPVKGLRELQTLQRLLEKYRGDGPEVIFLDPLKHKHCFGKIRSTVKLDILDKAVGRLE